MYVGPRRGKMKPQMDRHVLHFAKCQLSPRKIDRTKSALSQTLPTDRGRRSSRSACVSALIAMGFAVVLPIHAQQDWPPDDQYPAPQQYNAPQPYPQPQQYAPQPQQYADGQSPYRQSGYPPSGYQGQAAAYPQQGYGQQLAQTQPLSPDQLTQLVAPIALYPDALVAQILAASTYPAQVAAADQWLRSLGGASPDQVAAGADAQSSWDPSVKALSAFPQVLAMLDRNLQWTTNLGNAYYNQPQDVLQTIQAMRERAESAGNLQSTPQEQVSENQGYIDIAPPDPQVVSVPNYNPWNAYGQPVSPYPGFSLLGTIGSFVGSALVHYGPGIAMSAFQSTPWGWLGWGLDWLANSVLFNHNSWFTHSSSVADWGFPLGGPRYFPRQGWGNGSNRNGYRAGWAHEDTPYRSFNRPGESARSGWGQPVGRPIQNWGDARTAEGFNHGYPQRGEGFRPVAPAQHAYNHYPQPISRPQQFGSRTPTFAPRTQPASSYGRSGYGSGFYGQSRENNFGRSGMAHSNPAPSYRAPENTYRGSFGGRGNNAFGGSTQHSGGFHLFGNHNADPHGGRAPKAYSYNGGHSGWGGSGGSFKAPKQSHSFGGGGHYGGGGHFGGGHSGGGHSGGHSSSGHHH